MKSFRVGQGCINSLRSLCCQLCICRAPARNTLTQNMDESPLCFLVKKIITFTNNIPTPNSSKPPSTMATPSYSTQAGKESSSRPEHPTDSPWCPNSGNFSSVDASQIVLCRWLIFRMLKWLLLSILSSFTDGFWGKDLLLLTQPYLEVLTIIQFSNQAAANNTQHVVIE